MPHHTGSWRRTRSSAHCSMWGICGAQPVKHQHLPFHGPSLLHAAAGMWAAKFNIMCAAVVDIAGWIICETKQAHSAMKLCAVTT